MHGQPNIKICLSCLLTLKRKMLLNLQIKISYLDVFRPIGYMIYAYKNSHCSVKGWIKRL